MRDAHQLALLTAARRLGIHVDDRLGDWGIDAVRYRYADREVVIVDGRINRGLSFTAAQLCLSKPATRSILSELGLPVPAAVHLPADSRDALTSLIDLGPVVCKPPDGEWGTGVAMDLTSMDAVLEQVAHLGGVALVEEQVEGKDLRIQALGGVWPKSAGEIKNQQQWPGSETLKTYRRRVFDLVMALIERTDFSSPITAADPRWALIMAIEHECIHLQTTIPLIRRTPAELVLRPDGWEYGPIVPADSDARWFALPGGDVQLGRDGSDNRYFGWDNEYGGVRRVVAPFSMRSRPITNREMLAFVDDGGYREPRLWQSAEATAWFDEMAPSHPSAWVPEDGGYRYRAIFDEMEMPWDWPVLVNRHEAAAFARWAGARLPTEAEFRHVLDLDLADPDETLSRARHNVALRWGSPVPVGYLESAIGPSGIDLLGNVARWAEDDFMALSRDHFHPHPLYEDFSGPWFGGDHGVLLGAGFSATGHLCQVTMMRDFMQNHMDQIAGITLVKA